MKPRTSIVMQNIIREINSTFPFTIPEETLCAKTCSHGCPKKLLEYMSMEIDQWEERLKNGEIPNFRDIQKITKTSKKIYAILKKNNLV